MLPTTKDTTHVKQSKGKKGKGKTIIATAGEKLLSIFYGGSGDKIA